MTSKTTCKTQFLNTGDAGLGMDRVSLVNGITYIRSREFRIHLHPPYDDVDIFSNLQKITCLILRNLFGLYLFSHQSCATGTLLLQK